MNFQNREQNNIFTFVPEVFKALVPIIKSKYLYIGLVTVIAGTQLNYASQTYLHNYMSEGKTLPMLSDLILDNIPVFDLSFFYDLFCFLSSIVIGIYIIHKKEYNQIPFILLLCGIFLLVRGIFIVLTPFGNPPMFNGSGAPFNGFSKYELGVYPSGHVGTVFLYLLLAKDKIYKWILFIFLLIVMVSLFLSHSHYSIDILSGIFFAYAIRSFGNKYFTDFDLRSKGLPSFSGEDK
jgi:membrane-associated phospholipid phosphatase